MGIKALEIVPLLEEILEKGEINGVEERLFSTFDLITRESRDLSRTRLYQSGELLQFGIAELTEDTRYIVPTISKSNIGLCCDCDSGLKMFYADKRVVDEAGNKIDFSGKNIILVSGGSHPDVIDGRKLDHIKYSTSEGENRKLLDCWNNINAFAVGAIRRGADAFYQVNIDGTRLTSVSKDPDSGLYLVRSAKKLE